MRNHPDFIDSITNFEEINAVPEEYRRWSAISAVAAALQRKVYFDTGAFKVYPNMFIGLIGTSGAGKSLAPDLTYGKVLYNLSQNIIAPAGKRSLRYREFDLTVPILHAEGKVTGPQLLVELAQTSQLVPGTSIAAMAKQSAISLWTSEFGVLVKRRDEELQGILTDLWDSRDNISSSTKTVGKYYAENPCFNWIFGATPHNFVNNMPENAHRQGILSRIFPVVYTGADMVKTLRHDSLSEEHLYSATLDLAQIAKLKGEITFESTEVEIEVDEWFRADMPPVPSQVTVIDGYGSRRSAHFLKLLIVVTCSRTNSMQISREDFVRARKWFIEAEEKAAPLMSRFGMSESGYRMQEIIDKMKANGGQMAKIEFRSYVSSICPNQGEALNLIKAMTEAGIITTALTKVKLSGYKEE